jgi:hypothetical protein
MPAARRFLIAFLLATLTAFAAVGASLQVSRLRCWSGGYGLDAYLGLCQSINYGDYEHAALALALEPDAVRHFAEAEVMVLGNSRAQFAFSSPATTEFFRRKQVRFYNAAFSGGDGSRFADLLWQQLLPHPKLIVINADPFFLDFLSTPALAIVNQPQAARESGEAKQRFQRWHAAICQRLPVLCDGSFALFRSRLDGRLILPPFPLPRYPLPVAQTISAGLAADLVAAEAIGRRFLAERGLAAACVVLTVVPTETVPAEAGQRLAERLGLPFVLPDVGPLATFDHSHLDPASADRFAGAFWTSVEKRLDACLTHAAPSTSG